MAATTSLNYQMGNQGRPSSADLIRQRNAEESANRTAIAKARTAGQAQNQPGSGVLSAPSATPEAAWRTKFPLHTEPHAAMVPAGSGTWNSGGNPVYADAPAAPIPSRFAGAIYDGPQANAVRNPPPTGNSAPQYVTGTPDTAETLAANRRLTGDIQGARILGSAVESFDRALYAPSQTHIAGDLPKDINGPEVQAALDHAALPPSGQATGEAALARNTGAPVQTQYGTIGGTAQHTPDWESKVVAANPKIGQAGTPENKAFVDAFHAAHAAAGTQSTNGELPAGFDPHATASAISSGNNPLNPTATNAATAIPSGFQTGAPAAPQTASATPEAPQPPAQPPPTRTATPQPAAAPVATTDDGQFSAGAGGNAPTPTNRMQFSPWSDADNAAMNAEREPMSTPGSGPRGVNLVATAVKPIRKAFDAYADAIQPNEQ